MKKYIKVYFGITVVVLIDQLIKYWVHTHMDYGDYGERAVFGHWFKLHYTLNPGMAFGLEIYQEYGKLLLTCFRILAVSVMIWYLNYLIRRSFSMGFIGSISLVLAGAIGNLVDSIFYGVWFDNALYLLNKPFFYPWFHGQVIDMFYIDVWQGKLPVSIPIFGGQYVSLLPIFNLADFVIMLGILIIIIFQKRFLDFKSPRP